LVTIPLREEVIKEVDFHGKGHYSPRICTSLLQENTTSNQARGCGSDSLTSPAAI
jgi:hypothetical protein